MDLENITKIYKIKNREIIGLDNFSYSFLEGKFYAIVGHSGSGKSTLISIMGLIEPYTKGKYMINGKDVTKLDDGELSFLRMKNFGFIFQDYFLDSHLKAYENVILPMIANKNIGRKERKNKAVSLLNLVGLSERVDHYPDEMSGGEQQRVAIARALANNPNVILADEPTGNLDRENEKLVFEYLKKLSQNGKCVIVVSHSDIVKDYADVLIELDAGKMVNNAS